MNDELARRRRELAESVQAGEWAAAFERAPRDAFAPNEVWIADSAPGPRLRRVSRAEDPSGWLDAVLGVLPVNSQVDDGHPGDDPSATSGISDVRVVLDMLRALDPAPGMRVLEIGTGPGWNAGLLAARLGPGMVTSVEVDPAVAEGARGSLAAANLEVKVVTADGTFGYAPGAPYDGLIATCGVYRVPSAWVSQVRPGGVIVVPLRLVPNVDEFGPVVRLIVAGDGRSAGGRVSGEATFMHLRAQRPTYGGYDALAAGWEPVTWQTTLDPALDDGPPPVVLAALVAGAEYHWDEDQVLTVGTWQEDPGRGSFATADVYESKTGPWTVTERGPRRLWEETVAAHEWWVDAGRPGQERFGVTVHASGRQEVWLDEPDNTIGALPD